MLTGISNNTVSMKGLSSCSINTGNTLLSHIEPGNWYGLITRKISSLTSSMREVVSCGVVGIAALRRCFIRHENVNDKDKACEYIRGNLDLESKGSENKHELSYIRESFEEDRKRAYKLITGGVGLEDERGVPSDIKNLYAEVLKVKVALENIRADRGDVYAIKEMLERFIDRPRENKYHLLKKVYGGYKIERTLDRADFLDEIRRSLKPIIYGHKNSFVYQGENVLDTDETFYKPAEVEFERKMESRMW